jgi:type II secretory pathway pseudopilin PulG
MSKGSSFLELMIVILIMGILAGVGLIILSDNIKKARVVEVTEALGMTMTGAQAYYTIHRDWPDGMRSSDNGEFYEICKNTLGVTLPTTYVSSSQYVATIATPERFELKATFDGTGKKKVGKGVDDIPRTLMLLSGANGGNRIWSGTIPQKYRPK